MSESTAAEKIHLSQAMSSLTARAADKAHDKAMNSLSQNQNWERVGGGGPADVSKTARTLLQQIRPWYDQVSEADRQEQMRKRYPALQTAWDNYQMVLRMCENERSGEEADTDGCDMTQADMSGDAYDADESEPMILKHNPDTV